MLLPSQEVFEQLAKRANLIPVIREISADLDTPLSFFRRLDSSVELHKLSFCYLLPRAQGNPHLFHAFTVINSRCSGLRLAIISALLTIAGGGFRRGSRYGSMLSVIAVLAPKTLSHKGR